MSTGHHEERLAQKPLLETFLVISALTRCRVLFFFSGLEVNLVSDYFLDHSRASNPLLEGFPNGSADKESGCNAGDTGDVGLFRGLGGSTGGGNGKPLQSSFLKNPMDRGVWQATVHEVTSQT